MAHGSRKPLGAFGEPGLDAIAQNLGPVRHLVAVGEFLGGARIVPGFLSRFSAASLIVVMISDDGSERRRMDRRNETAASRRPSGRAERRRVISAVAAAWIASLAFDLLLHAGALARLYVEPSGFLLAPEDAFRRIPLGYGAFLVLTLGVYWLFRRIGIRGGTAGFRFGVIAGALVWGAFAAGLYSMSTVSLPLVLGWWIGQALELGLAGAVLGAAESGVSHKRIWFVVGLCAIASVIGVVALQSAGLAPPMKTLE